VAGSYRRRKETVGDLDILAVCRRGSDIVRRFVAFEDVDRVVAEGRTRSTVVLRGLKINEYGVFKGQKRRAGRDEKEVYAQVDLPCIAPELREDSGEIDAAENGLLPDLVDTGDIRGDLHAHTRATAGRATLEEMAAAARERGYDYLAITEHSRRGWLEAEDVINTRSWRRLKRLLKR